MRACSTTDDGGRSSPYVADRKNSGVMLARQHCQQLFGFTDTVDEHVDQIGCKALGRYAVRGNVPQLTEAIEDVLKNCQFRRRNPVD